MKVKSALSSMYSKKKVSLQPKLLKQKKLKQSLNSGSKVEVLSKQKVNLAMTDMELIDRLKAETRANNIKLKAKKSASKQTKSHDLGRTKNIDNSMQIKTMSTSQDMDSLKQKKSSHSNSVKMLTSKSKSKQIEVNLKTNKTPQRLEKVKKTGKGKQIQSGERSFNTKELKSRKLKQNVGNDANKITTKHKLIKSKKENLNTQNSVQDLREFGNQKEKLKPMLNNPNSIKDKHSKKPSIKSPRFEQPKQLTTIDNIDISKHVTKKMSFNNHTPNVEDMRKEQLNLKKVTAAVNALYKIMKGEQTELLNLAEPIFMEVECIKIPQCTVKQLRFKLPHPLVNELSDILLITADKKGAKIYPDKAVEHYTELLAKHDINFIQEVIPLRSICAEYSQYELRKKLVDKYDMILADATIINSLGNRLGKHVLYKRKMPLPVHLDRKDLKKHFLLTISKTQMTVKGNGHLTAVQVGHTKMTAYEVAANILAVTETLDSVYPGGFKNIRSLDIKTSNSISLPVFFSLVPSSSVETPVERPKPLQSVSGELTSQLHSNVVVKADGTVLVRRAPKPSTLPMDDSHDDEILRAAKEYEESAKTIHYNENEDSDDENEAATSAMEDKLLKKYDLAKKKKEEDVGEKEEDDEEEEEEGGEESSDEEEPVVLPVGQKRKKGLDNKASEKSPEKKQKKVHQQGRLKETTQKKEVKRSGQIKQGDQRRGSRGGKKQKMNKDQRKAWIKRKKAGKK